MPAIYDTAEVMFRKFHETGLIIHNGQVGYVEPKGRRQGMSFYHGGIDPYENETNKLLLLL